MFGKWHQQMILLLCRRSGYQSVTCGAAFCKFSSYSPTGIEASKHMQKLLTKKGVKTKRKWYQPHIAEPLELSGKQERPNKKGVSEAQGHRSRQLSHVLYTRICQIANSGELSEEVLNKQIFFTRVKMHPTFTGINVYWDANRSDAADIEQLLTGLSGKLRSLLISYHVLGRIPNITFVKDGFKGDLTRLNQLFEVADYGPDYLPSTMRNQNDAHITLGNDTANGLQRTSGEAFLNQGLSALSLEDPEVHVSNNWQNDSFDVLSSEAGWQPHPFVDDNSGKTSPEDAFSFRSDLYGLPREALMKKVMAQKQKTKYQKPDGSNEFVSSTTDSRFKDYVKLQSKIKDKEKIIRKRNSTKLKQRLLEQEFEEVQESLVANTNNQILFDNEIDSEKDDN